MPEYFDWVIPDRTLIERWDYREFKEYPPGDESESTIRAFIEDAKDAEGTIEEELKEQGLSEEEAVNDACQWPLKDDAPIEIIRNFISYKYGLQEAAKEGVDF